MKYERGWHIESTPTTSALDQWGLMVQSRLPSTDDTLAGFEQTIVPHLDAAYKLARLLSKDADAAQDIVQEAFLRAYRGFAGYRGENARAWISRIVRNCYYRWLMSRKSRGWRSIPTTVVTPKSSSLIYPLMNALRKRCWCGKKKDRASVSSLIRCLLLCAKY
jgi:Sigma-70 region 2